MKETRGLLGLTTEGMMNGNQVNEYSDVFALSSNHSSVWRTPLHCQLTFINNDTLRVTLLTRSSAGVTMMSESFRPGAEDWTVFIPAVFEWNNMKYCRVPECLVTFTQRAAADTNSKLIF